jgi:DNA-binding transcriptional ArsR family regulator
MPIPQTTPLLTSISEISNLSNGAHRALVGLLSFRHKETGRCCPRVATLSQRLGGVPYGTVRRWLRDLRRSGVVETSRHRGSNSYRIDLVKSCGKPPGSEHIHRPRVAIPERPKVDAQDRPKMDGLDSPKMDGLAGSILTEQTEKNRQRGTRAAADVKVAAVVGQSHKRKVAAAAAKIPSVESAETQKSNTPEPAKVTAAASKIVAELMPRHPEPGNGPRAVAEVAKLLSGEPKSLSRTMATLRRHHELWRGRWASYPPGRFIPQLWRWIADGDWQHPPAERKETHRETYQERSRREMKEYDEKLYRGYAERGMWKALRDYGGEELVEKWRAKIKAKKAR